MDRVTLFYQKINEVITEYIEERKNSESVRELCYQPIIDKENHHFQLILLGWKDGRRIFSLLFHIDIIKDKIWIQEDNLEYSVAERLVAKKVAKKDIVLAYFSSAHRQHTEYAIA